MDERDEILAALPSEAATFRVRTFNFPTGVPFLLAQFVLISRKGMRSDRDRRALAKRCGHHATHTGRGMGSAGRSATPLLSSFPRSPRGGPTAHRGLARRAPVMHHTTRHTRPVLVSGIRLSRPLTTSDVISPLSYRNGRGVGGEGSFRAQPATSCPSPVSRGPSTPTPVARPTSECACCLTASPQRSCRTLVEQAKRLPSSCAAAK
jgi:hypothetical protein